ncbi:MAG TPA: phospholipase D-like domain-containing protein, partial [Stellaceae bacterium]|nr:phospholipase D-like domain-containing protein [Stellaceae bacterium]
MLTAALSGCASLSDADDFAASAPDHSSRPKIVGASGPLSARATRRLLDKIAPEPGESRLLRRHLTIEQAVAGTPLIADNRTQLLRDGPDTFAAMFAAMKGAKHHINLEYYILEDVESGGTPLSDLLLAKRREGVAVHVIYDSYGSGSTPSEFFDKLKAAGIHLLAFNPVNPLETRTSYSLNDRDHRKILVVDGATAIVGGINLSTTYESNRFGRAAAPQTEAADHWRDTDLVIEGPAVAELQHLFVEHWMSQNGPPLDDATFFPPVPPKGNEVVRIIGSTPDNAIPRYYVTLVSAIRTAERSVWLSAAYFVPTHQEKEDLEDAARRGVDVRLLLPAKSDSDRALAVAHSHYEDLMEAGVKIYE